MLTKSDLHAHLRPLLSELIQILDKYSLPQASSLKDVLTLIDAGNDAQIAQGLVSHEIWGGSGSVMDVASEVKNQARGWSDVERYRGLIVDLGKLMDEAGIGNKGTRQITRAFERWNARRIGL